MKFRVFTQLVAGWLALGASAAFGHGFDLSVNSFANPTSVTAISQSPFFDLYEETSAPQNLFLGAFGASLQSNSGGLFYSIIHGAAETSGAFPDYTATVNVVSPLYFADGSSKFASLAPTGTQLVLTNRFVGQYPGATAGSITVTGQSGVYPTGLGVSLFDAHELLKQLYFGSGPTDGEYGFAYDITIHFASGQTLTTGPLVNVFAISDPDAGDFADFATPAQQDAATRAIYGAAMADVNFDAKVDIQDLTMIANHWLQSGVIGQLSGDANRDGRVDIQDVTSVANFWNPGTTGGGGALVGVPEPTGLALGGFGLAIWVVAFLRRRAVSGNR